MAGPYRAENLGSFLRPGRLKDARVAARDRRITPERLQEIEDIEILAVLERQRQAGIDVYSDGEFRRGGFMSDLQSSVEGYVTTDEAAVTRTWQGAGGQPSNQGLDQVVASKLKKVRRMTDVQTAFLKDHSPGPFKMTIPSAVQFPTLGFKPGVTDKVYPTRSDLLWDLVDIIKSEITAMAEEGVTYIQIDAPRYSYFVDPKWRQHLVDLGEDPDKMFEEAIAADNASIAGAKRDGITTAIHVCRGNNQSKWYAEGGYEPIAEKLFNELDVDVFLLEYDTDRAGTFEPLRFVPNDKTVVLGLVSTKEPAMEGQDVLRRRIDEASQYVSMDRLALSTQCGFASMETGNLISDDEQWRKMDLVVKTARRVWG